METSRGLARAAGSSVFSPVNTLEGVTESPLPMPGRLPLNPRPDTAGLAAGAFTFTVIVKDETFGFLKYLPIIFLTIPGSSFPREGFLK